MRNAIKISVPQPCAEQWENFTVTPHGGFCGSCSTTVIDFTAMSDAEVVKFFKGKSGEGRVCGRFRPDQIKTYTLQELPKFRPGVALLRAGFVGMLVLFAGQFSYAQQVETKKPAPTDQSPGSSVTKAKVISDGITVRGVVRDAQVGETVPGVNVVLKGTPIGTITDARGRFEFPDKLHDHDVLVFSFIGMTTPEYVVLSEGKDLDIEVDLDSDVVVLGAVAVDEPFKTPRGLSAFWDKLKHIF
ncbi:MAG TPA: carboxypeptidase-like regulatory domain-containing protein [Cyclobacteriaceae bacterium]|nr:carboxypeptidase-like regulatory domain-containing protein [Cyclobacteriaceae bacterium]